MPIFFISSTDIQGSSAYISPPLSFHLSKSLRLQPGDSVVLGDERRQRHRAIVKRMENQQLIAEIQDTQNGPEPELPPIILVQSILKSEKMDWVIQKSTELGVERIVPILTERVVRRFSSATGKRHQERWQKIALEAAQQSERWDVPIVSEIQTFEDFCAVICPDKFCLILVERQPSPSLFLIPFPVQWEGGFTFFVGPEGGWTEAELIRATKSGCQMVSLGQRIFRSETATLAALSLLQARLGRLGS